MITEVAIRDDGRVLVDVRCGPYETSEAFGLALAEYANLMPCDTQPNVVIKIDNDKRDCMDCGYVQISTK